MFLFTGIVLSTNKNKFAKLRMLRGGSTVIHTSPFFQCSKTKPDTDISKWENILLNFVVSLFLSLVSGTTITRPHPPRIYIMACLCNENRTFIKMTQDEIIAFLIIQTEIPSNSTASSFNKYHCMEDSRISSKIMGLIGSIIIATVFGILLTVDLINFYSHCKIK